MAQNIYDDPQFFTNYAQLPRSRKGLEGAPEWGTLRQMLPPIRDKRIVDLGCGYGWFCRWAQENGAASVLGLDLSEKMLAQARASTDADTIEYRRADLEHLALPTDHFDLAYSSLTLHYLEDLGRLFRTLYEALKPGGWLVFSIEHPIFMASKYPAWCHNIAGERTWPVDHYQDEGPRRTDWLGNGVIKQHRTLGTLLNLLLNNGFNLRHVEDWGPTPQQIHDWPALEEEKERPMLLLISAQRNDRAKKYQPG